jgi:hypothetical protein
MFAGGTCSAGSSTSTTPPRRDRIWVSDPHGQRSAKLQEKFGPEYERTVAEKGDTRKAEDELTDR